MYSSLYYEGEFYKNSDIKLLFSSVKGDFEFNIDAAENSVDWLNEVLRISNLYDKLLLTKHKKKLLRIFDKLKIKNIERLFALSKNIRKKLFDDLDQYEKNILLRFNRMLMDEVYLKSPPREYIDESFGTETLDYNKISTQNNISGISIAIIVWPKEDIFIHKWAELLDKEKYHEFYHKESTRKYYDWRLDLKLPGPNNRFNPGELSLDNGEINNVIVILESALSKMKKMKEQMISSVKISMNKENDSPFIEIEMSEGNVSMKFWIHSKTYRLCRSLTIENAEELLSVFKLADDTARKTHSEWILLNA